MKQHYMINPHEGNIAGFRGTKVGSAVGKISSFFGLMKTPEQLVKKGNAEYDARNYGAALRKYVAAEKMGHPFDCELCKRCGDINRKKGEYDTSLRYYQKAIDDIKDMTRQLSERIGKYYIRNDLYISLMEREGTIHASYLIRYLKDHEPTNEISHFFKTMNDAFSEIHEIRRKIGKTHYLMGNYGKAAEIFQRAARNSVNMPRMKGVFDVDDGLLTSWEMRCMLGKYGPEYMAKFYVKLGKSWLKNEDYSHAVFYFKEAVNIDYKNPEYQLLLSEAHCLNNDLYSAHSAALVAEVFGRGNPIYPAWVKELSEKINRIQG